MNKKLLFITLLATLCLAESMHADPIWTTTFGTRGASNEQVRNPYGIALNSEGKIYVTDRDNMRVQIFNPDTTYSNKFGSQGFGNGEFLYPRGIVLDSEGKIYVADYFRNRVQIFNPDTTFFKKFASGGSANDQGPVNIALDSENKIYVTDTFNNRVQIYNSDTTYLRQFGVKGSDNGQFSELLGIALDSENKIYITDKNNNRVQIFNPDTTYSSKFGSEGSGNGQFDKPFGIALDNSTGNIYVTEADNTTGVKNHRIQIFDKDGNFISKFGSEGSGKGQFNNPSGIALQNSSGKIYVVDQFNSRIVMLFDPSLWTKAGESILGTLTLDQDLTLKQNYHLVIQSMDDTTTKEIVKSDGKLTITNNAILTANPGSSIAATGLVIDKATLIVKTSDVPNNMNFTSPDGKLLVEEDITSDIDFAGNDSVLTLGDGQTITGKVDSSTAPGGIIDFAGVGTVTGAIGATNPLTKLKFSGAGDIEIPAANATNIEIANAGANITASGVLKSNVLYSEAGSLLVKQGVTGDVIFNAAGILTTSGISGIIDCVDQPATINFLGDNDYILNNPIQNGKNATLNVNLPKLTVTSLEISSINISDNKVLAIDLATGDKILLAAGGDGIKFLGANSAFQIKNTGNYVRVASLAANLVGKVGGGGILLLSGGEAGLTLTGVTPATTIGITGSEISMLEVQGDVTMQDNIDASGVSTFNIVIGANFTDQSGKTGQIPTINIGSSVPLAYSTWLTQPNQVRLMRATDASVVYTLDVSNVAGGNLNILDQNHTINFIDDNATLKLLNKTANENIVTLLSDLDPGKDNFGRVELEADSNSILTVTGGSLGTSNHKLKQLELLGDGVINIKSTIHTVDLELNVPAITLADVHSNLSFATNTVLTENGDIEGSVDFQNKAAIINLADGHNIIGAVNSTGGNNGMINSQGTGAIFGVVTNLAMLKAGTGDFKLLAPGDYSITEIQGNGTNSIIFPANINFTGDVNATGGEAVNLNFADNSNIYGNIGSAANPVGDIQTSGNSNFKGSVNNIGDITTNNITNFDDTVTSKGNITTNGTTTFNNIVSTSQNLTILDGSTVILANNLNANNVIANNSNIETLNNLAIKANISGTNTNIDLQDNQLILVGNIVLSNQLTIATTYNAASLSGGSILLSSGSSLDLSKINNLLVKLAFTNSDISQINDETQYVIILSEDGTSLITLTNPDTQIKLDSSGEQNRFVRWTLDPKSLTLYASDISDEILDKELQLGSSQNKEFARQLKHVLPNSDAERLKNNLGLLNQEQTEEIFERLLDQPKQQNSEVIRHTLHNAITNTHNSTMSTIQGRTRDVSVGAGDDEANQYGVWDKISINHSKDKTNSKTSEYSSSYKTQGHNNTIGIDNLISENLLVGAAYTNAYTKIKQQNQNIGDIDKARTNMFSLYSSYNIPNYNWFIDSTLSYAKSSIRGYKIRNLALFKGVVGNEIASSKFKSYLYSGSLSLGYNHNLYHDLYVSPTLGVIGSLIRDKGYKESGTSFQNLEKKKKHYSKVSSIIGLGVLKNIYLDKVILTPKIYGAVNYAFQNKNPIINTQLQGIDENLPTVNSRSNRVDYNIGVGLLLQYKMMEYGLDYNANIAKKFHAHSGSIKLKLNF